MQELQQLRKVLTELEKLQQDCLATPLEKLTEERVSLMREHLRKMTEVALRQVQGLSLRIASVQSLLTVQQQQEMQILAQRLFDTEKSVEQQLFIQLAPSLFTGHAMPVEDRRYHPEAWQKLKRILVQNGYSISSIEDPFDHACTYGYILKKIQT